MLNFTVCLNSLVHWCYNNILQRNVKKSKVFSLSRNKYNIEYFKNFSGSALEDCKQISNLAVIVGRAMTFILQLHYICNSTLRFLDLYFGIIQIFAMFHYMEAKLASVHWIA